MVNKISVLLLGLACSTIIYAQQDAPRAVRTAPVPEVGGANLPSQPIGANDLIAVTVYDAPELSRTVRVGADGFIRLPMLKQRIHVEQLYPSDVENLIAEELKKEEILVDPFVTVTIAEYHSRPISVTGAVKKPLVFQADAPTTVLEAISRAEGLAENAGPEILVSTPQTGPDGKSTILTRRISVRELIDAADPAANITLTGGEEIRVPEAEKIFVVGSVARPGAFPVHDGESMTVLQTLALAQGLAPYAAKEAYVYRQEASGSKNEIPIPLQKIMKRQSPDVPLLANDILYIPDSTGRKTTLKALEAILPGVASAGAYGAIIYK